MFLTNFVYLHEDECLALYIQREGEREREQDLILHEWSFYVKL